MEQTFRLAGEPGGLGLSCGDAGLRLAGVALLRKSAGRFEPRSATEIDTLLKGAYGRKEDVIRLGRGLDVVAEALNRADLGRAMIAAVHLRLPELDAEGAACLARVDDILAKYDPNEPRDERGRWTTGGAAAPAATLRDGRRRPPFSHRPVGQIRPRSSATAPAPTAAGPGEGSGAASPSSSSWSGPTHLYGGRIIPVQEPPGIGGNDPPPDFAMDAAPGERLRPQARDIEGDRPSGPPLGYIPGDPFYPMNDGVRWSEATHDLILKTLSGTGRKDPQMVIFVPLHGKGPVLTVPERDKDYTTPEGYLPVRLIGIPQVTRPVGRKSFHAYDSVDEALKLATTKQFGTIFFNRAWSKLTNGEIRSLIRNDVVAVMRPGQNVDFIYHPAEVLSRRQTPEQQQRRMPIDPRINPELSTKPFRSSSYRRSPYFEYFDTRRHEA